MKEGSRAERSYSTDDGGGKNSVGKGAMAEAMELGMSLGELGMGMAMVEEMNGAAVRGGFSRDEPMVERFAPRRIYALLSRLIGARTIHIPVRQLNVG